MTSAQSDQISQVTIVLGLRNRGFGSEESLITLNHFLSVLDEFWMQKVYIHAHIHTVFTRMETEDVNSD